MYRTGNMANYISRTHTSGNLGIDITNQNYTSINGFPIYAQGSGTVTDKTSSNSNLDDRGHFVSITYGNGYVVRYLHLQSAPPVSGTVNPSTLLGYTGSTGDSTGPHLHFDVRVNGNYTQPTPLFPNNTFR
jgi:murein DD-endopeptidase MepM/ murein hydrolase activator NlpD